MFTECDTENLAKGHDLIKQKFEKGLYNPTLESWYSWGRIRQPLTQTGYS